MALYFFFDKVISSTYMAACGLQPGRKGSGTGRTSMGDARYSRSSTTMGMYNNKGKRMCLYICSVYCKSNILSLYLWWLAFIFLRPPIDNNTSNPNDKR